MEQKLRLEAKSCGNAGEAGDCSYMMARKYKRSA